jgi:Zn-dependent protease
MAGVAFIIVIAVTITVHEFAHAYAAYKCGDPTAKVRGRLTLNPIAHLDPMGALMMLVAGFGWAKPVPVDPANFKNYKASMAIVSVAGVVTNLVMAGVWLLLLYLAGGHLLFHGLLGANQAVRVFGLLGFYLMFYGAMLNFMFAFFNLLPIAPLDGFNLINTFLPRGNPFTAFMRRYGFVVLIALLLIGFIGDFVGAPYLNIFGMFGRLISNLIDTVLRRSLGA